MQVKNHFTDSFRLRYPIIMAPMFLVSNVPMIKEAIRCGILGVFPSLNFRNEGELEKVLSELNEYKKGYQEGTYGVNLIVQKTNPLYQQHLAACVAYKVPFYITSLGSPKEVIEKAHSYGAKVYCDVTNLEHAKKCASLNCDGFIAVGQGAGGHAGPYPLSLLVERLSKEFPNMPIISAGGVSTGKGILSALSLGATGVSIGTRFIASAEATISDAYKDAVVNSGMNDIVLTERLSGTPCNIINTPFAQKIGYKQNWLERLLSNNSRTKKYFKMLVQFRGMRKLEESVKPGNYQTLWCAGQSAEMIEDIAPIAVIVEQFQQQFDEASAKLVQTLQKTLV